MNILSNNYDDMESVSSIWSPWKKNNKLCSKRKNGNCSNNSKNKILDENKNLKNLNLDVNKNKSIGKT